MKKLCFLALLVSVAMGITGCATIDANPLIENTTEINENETEEMQKFPSYDWSGDDGAALAYVSANTPGTNQDKQKAIINVLNYIWYENNAHLSVAEYVARKYDGYNQPTSADYALLRLVVKGEWADNDVTYLHNVAVDIYKESQGWCVGSYSDIKIEYYNDEISHITIANPVTLYFKVPDKYEGGVVMFSGIELEQLKELLENSEYDKVKEFIDELYAIEDCPT